FGLARRRWTRTRGSRRTSACSPPAWRPRTCSPTRRALPARCSHWSPGSAWAPSWSATRSAIPSGAPSWVGTSCSPGSPSSIDQIERPAYVHAAPGLALEIAPIGRLQEDLLDRVRGELRALDLEKRCGAGDVRGGCRRAVVTLVSRPAAGRRNGGE